MIIGYNIAYLPRKQHARRFQQYQQLYSAGFITKTNFRRWAALLKTNSFLKYTITALTFIKKSPKHKNYSLQKIDFSKKNTIKNKISNKYYSNNIFIQKKWKIVTKNKIKYT